MGRNQISVDLRNERIKVTLKTNGILLRDIAEELAVTPGLVSGALLGRFRSARVERAVAAHLDTTPQNLWPDRVHENKAGGPQCQNNF